MAVANMAHIERQQHAPHILRASSMSRNKYAAINFAKKTLAKSQRFKIR
jgi:hypothetical protein